MACSVMDTLQLSIYLTKFTSLTRKAGRAGASRRTGLAPLGASPFYGHICSLMLMWVQLFVMTHAGRYQLHRSVGHDRWSAFSARTLLLLHMPVWKLPRHWQCGCFFCWETLLQRLCLMCTHKWTDILKTQHLWPHLLDRQWEHN